MSSKPGSTNAVSASDADSPLRPVVPRRPGEMLGWRHLHGSAPGLAIAEAARQHQGPVLIVTHDTRSAQRLEEEIRFFAPASLPILPFPDWESLPYDAFSPHQDIISRRLLTLYQLPALSHGVVLLSVSTLMHRLPARDYIHAHSLALDVGDRVDLESFRTQLLHSAYQAVTQVMVPGEYAVRGGLIDIFPMGSDTPYRIDLFDDRIESIRSFDPESQRSGEKLPAVRLLPAREYPMTPAAIQRFRQEFRARFEGDPQKMAVYRDVSKGLSPAGIEYYLPLFFEQTASLFDYLPASTLCLSEEEIDAAATSFRAETDERYRVLRGDPERPVLAPEQLFLDPARLAESLGRFPRVVLKSIATDTVPISATGTHPDMTATAYPTEVPPRLPVDHRADNPHAALFDWLRTFSGRILVVAETPGRREVLRALLHDHGFYPQACANWQEFLAADFPLGMTVASLEKGLALSTPRLSIVTESQLYGERAAQRRRRTQSARDPDAVIRNLAELRLNDPVVHEDHGVGRYLGLQTLDVGDGPTEFLALEYAGGDKLYTPVTDLQRVSRYTGADPEHAPLHKLGNDAWEKAKRRARQKAHDAAVELLEVQALRLSRPGHAFPRRDEHYAVFAAAFPFEETPDQARAIEETLQDMETSRPMDRLVCGDVGFGKTEVALRAAFIAVQDHRQVAVLVPTTLLAQQHFQSFADRFADVTRRNAAPDDAGQPQLPALAGQPAAPIRIELLSRFRTKSEQSLTLNRIASGEVDIVIGTHRLLQEDIHFKRLGLLIIDEEHRFGVRQKERMKKLRSEVDILTLTATPVPRTLNMALSGLRDVSMIATAPESRLSVKTFVCEWNDALLREACLREIRRGGQVYFLHNDVKTMDKALRQLHELVPEADIRIAHGQMPERDLERVMIDFYHQRFSILLCSTIIETGIDIPSANTIIIQRADKFGLAQLHQLRGRVGRSHHRAYAYLLVPPRTAISGDALKRLEAIASIEDLGAGFALASHDLEIRGAGELLGEAQSGQIDEVGFTLYSELLNRAVVSLKSGRNIDLEQPPERSAEINLHVPALLPGDYIPDVHMRLMLYKRIAETPTYADLTDLQAELIDRFGLLPLPAQVLFKVMQLKMRADAIGVRKIEAGPKGARIEFGANPNVDPGTIIRLLQSAPKCYRLDGPSRLRVIGEMPEAEDRIKALQGVFDALDPISQAARR
ncbi:MAG: transcription-repair coupling factor [Acidiferrobacterales bacterium]